MMKKSIEKTWIALLFLCAFVLVIPGTGAWTQTVQATESDSDTSCIASGTCGDDLTWTLTNDGALTISGTGEMTSYSSFSEVPWYDYRESITEIVVEDGVSSLTDAAFYYCTEVTSVKIADSVTSLGSRVFSYMTSLEEIVLPDSVTAVPVCAFYGSSNLTSVTLSTELISIGYQSFCYTGMSEITIPSSVTVIKDYAFYGSSLEIITFEGDAPSAFGNNVFSDAVYLLYHSSKNGWDTAQSSWSVPDGTVWIDMDAQISAASFAFAESSYLLSTGGSVTVSTNADAYTALLLTYSSSDPSIAAVTQSGKVLGISGGTATITAQTEDGSYKAACTVTVSADTSTLGKTMTTVSDAGAVVTDNVSDNNYSSFWASTVKSYLYENSDGSFTRVEYTSDGVIVEVYSEEFDLQTSQTIENALSIFGGFCSGETYNFLVFGQSNTDEDDTVEVIRVIKYDKEWNQIDECSISGVNTYIPFHSGSLRMTETGGNLYIRTSHQMYASSDGKRHQANMTFVIEESDMTVTESHYLVAHSNYGYVSHSFNQFIQTDGEYVYCVDHGDGYPRGIALSKTTVDSSNTSVSQKTVYSILGETGANATGVSVGGFELSSDNCLIAGNSVDMTDEENYSVSGTRNIFVSVTDQGLDQGLGSSTTVWFTDYTSDDGITVRTPQLVKLNSDVFLLMWEEESDDGIAAKLVLIDGDGNAATEIYELDVRLSDCQPILTEDGLVTWYVTDGSKVRFYQLNPYRLSETTVGTQIDEIAGSTRYETMAQIALETFGGAGSEYAVIATGTNFPDALAAASLAGVLDAPVILVNDKNISIALETLEELGVTKAYIIGGTSAVSASAASQIQSVTGSIERISGENRFETAIAIAEKVQEIQASSGETASDTCIVASGASFPDALSGSPYAYWSGSPIYLAKADGSLSEETLAAIKEGGYSQIIVLGGTSAVSMSLTNIVMVTHANTKRIGGSNRYETAALVAEWSVEQGMTYDGLAVATGTDFPDALSGSALCGQNGSVLLLANSTAEKSNVLESVIEENAADISYLYVLGGTSAVSEEIREMIRSALGG